MHKYGFYLLVQVSGDKMSGKCFICGEYILKQSKSHISYEMRDGELKAVYYCDSCFMSSTGVVIK